MKTMMTQTLTLLAVVALWGAAPGQENQPAETQPNQEEPPPTEEQQQALGELMQAVADAQAALAEAQARTGNTNAPADPKLPRPIRGQGARGSAGTGTNVVSLTALAAKNGTNHTATSAANLRLNFRNAPLSLVLDYLSEAAGFTISPSSKVDLKGTVTVWSNQPLTREQAVGVLNKALGEHHYAATVEDDLLNIYVVDSTNTEILAGVPENDHTKISPTQELVTQIVYVHNVEANQLITSLQPLMPSGTSMSANQGANAIVLTDTKSNIRRMVQLVKALDTASVSAASLKVFLLQEADATALAQVVSQLFQTDTSSSRDRGRGFFGGGFPFGGDRGGDRGGGGGSAQPGRMSAAKVVAVADDRSNALVVSASDEHMEMVEKLVAEMDQPVGDVTELRVFRLRYADPTETAEQLATLFPDPTTQQNASGRSGFRGFGFFGGFDRSRSSSSPTDSTSRKVRMTRVTAVPDPRTGSVIVSAARELMGQIAGIVEELDSDPAKKKKVYVIKVENRDPQEIVEQLQSVISADTTGGSTSSRSTQNSATQLGTRQQNNLRNQNTSSSSFNTTIGGGGTRTGR